jgi:hypothetical protein
VFELVVTVLASDDCPAIVEIELEVDSFKWNMVPEAKEPPDTQPPTVKFTVFPLTLADNLIAPLIMVVPPTVKVEADPHCPDPETV